MCHTLSSVVGIGFSITSRWAVRGAFAVLAAALIVGGSPQAHAAVFDDFSDLDDTANPTWTHLNGNLGSTGQTWSAATGQYRLTAPNNGFFLNGGNLGFVGSYTGPSFTDVEVRADFVQSATGGAYGVVARGNGNNAFNSFRGYAYAYEPFAGAGEMVLYRVVGGNATDLGSQGVTLDVANKDYTFVLKVTGNQLHGQVYEIGGGLIAEKFATDSNFTSGTSGVFGFSSTLAVVPTDFTIDNFQARVPEPATSLLVACGVAAIHFGRRRFR